MRRADRRERRRRLTGPTSLEATQEAVDEHLDDLATDGDGSSYTLSESDFGMLLEASLDVLVGHHDGDQAPSGRSTMGPALGPPDGVDTVDGAASDVEQRGDARDIEGDARAEHGDAADQRTSAASTSAISEPGQTQQASIVPASSRDLAQPPSSEADNNDAGNSTRIIRRDAGRATAEDESSGRRAQTPEGTPAPTSSAAPSDDMVPPAHVSMLGSSHALSRLAPHSEAVRAVLAIADLVAMLDGSCQAIETRDADLGHPSASGSSSTSMATASSSDGSTARDVSKRGKAGKSASRKAPKTSTPSGESRPKQQHYPNLHHKRLATVDPRSIVPKRTRAVIFPESESEEDGKAYKGPCVVTRLPSETLTRILRFARQCMEHDDPVAMPARRRLRSGTRDQLHFARLAEFRNPPNPLETQLWILKMQTVCKAWTPVARSVAWNSLQITSDRILTNVLQVLESKPEVAELIGGSAFIEMSAVPTVVNPSDLDWGTMLPIAAPPAEKNSDEPSPETRVARFLEKATLLQRLDLASGRVHHCRT